MVGEPVCQARSPQTDPDHRVSLGRLHPAPRQWEGGGPTGLHLGSTVTSWPPSTAYLGEVDHHGHQPVPGEGGELVDPALPVAVGV